MAHNAVILELMASRLTFVSNNSPQYVGHVLCDVDKPIPVARVFDAQIKLTNVENIICAGFTCVLHIHSAVEEVKVSVCALFNCTKGVSETVSFLRPRSDKLRYFNARNSVPENRS